MVQGKLWENFIMFCSPYIKSGDIDPVYPVLKKVYDLRKMNAEERIWHTMLYLTWYHLGSADKMRDIDPEIFRNNYPPVLPTGVERRGFRGNVGARRAQEFIVNLLNKRETHGGWSTWVSTVISHGDTPEERWSKLFEEIIQMKYCGTWAAYKCCDLFANVLNYPITAPDIGYGGGGENAGPIPGMVQLTGENWIDCANNVKGIQQKLYHTCLLAGIPLNGMEQMETALCDFNSVTHGRYYVGHDIDKQMEDIMGLDDVYWKARSLVFNPVYLGEYSGWSGVRPFLNTYYQRTGNIFTGGSYERRT
jgi:hypothetical protein